VREPPDDGRMGIRERSEETDDAVGEASLNRVERAADGTRRFGGRDRGSGDGLP
jgi:hypothetical protein